MFVQSAFGKVETGGGGGTVILSLFYIVDGIYFLDSVCARVGSL